MCTFLSTGSIKFYENQILMCQEQKKNSYTLVIHIIRMRGLTLNDAPLNIIKPEHFISELFTKINLKYDS